MIVADEASGVHDIIFQTAEGALTGQDILFILIGNPLRREGYFFDSHNDDKENWQCFNFNSEDSPIVDKKFVNRIISKYTKESDEYRFRVKGVPPSEANMDSDGYTNLLTDTEIKLAMQTAPHFGQERMGIDVADTGSNSSVIIKRSAGYAEILLSEKSIDLMDFAGQIKLKGDTEFNSDLRYLDKVGVGSGCLSRLHQLKFAILGINAGDPASDKKYFNKKAEMYWRVREWIKGGGKLSKDSRWLELVKIKYKPTGKGQMQIMTKKEMIKKGIPSPDHADALALTFYDAERPMAKTLEEKEFDKKMRAFKKKRRGGGGYNLKMA